MSAQWLKCGNIRGNHRFWVFTERLYFRSQTRVWINQLIDYLRQTEPKIVIENDKKVFFPGVCLIDNKSESLQVSRFQADYV